MSHDIEAQLQQRMHDLRRQPIPDEKGVPAPLSKDEERILEYFWNTTFQSRISHVPAAAIYFLEGQKLTPSGVSPAARELITLWLQRLMSKGYLAPEFQVLTDLESKEHANLELAADGRDYINRGRFGWLREPLIYAGRQLPLWQFIAAVMGIVVGAVTLWTRLS